MTKKQILIYLKAEIKRQTRECEAIDWIDDEDGMWMQGYLKALETVLNKIKE